VVRIWMDGAESAEVSGSVSVEKTSTSGSVTADTGRWPTGKAYKCSAPSSTTAYVTNNGVANPSTSSWYVRFYFKVDALPTNTAKIFAYAVSPAYTVRLTSAGVLGIWDGGSPGTQVSSSISGITANTWYVVWLTFTGVSSLNLGVAYADYDYDTANALNVSGSVASLATAQSTYFGWVSVPGNSANIWIDDIAVNDNTGASENALMTGGHIGLMFPTSDSNRGSWTGGAGGTTNVYTGIDNAPPVGVASASATNTSQIKTATSGTQNYDGQCSSYASGLGMSTEATIKLVRLISAFASTTTTVTGSQLIVSSPTQSVADTFNFPNGTMSTYPSGWGTLRGAIQYAPSVTPASTPVIRITKTQSQARNAECCFLGLEVEWSEPQSRPGPIRVPSGITQAITRASVW
jgi:hypothetical protein